ncbi:MAG: DUF350 domain-containing protein [Elusimicrobia bacterium]|nr:DUF350 domain-containing protein [Elusimicrobiota bacterium]
MLAFILGVVKLFISALLAVLVVFLTYKVFIKANTDFDEEVEIKKGNVAVGILITALLLGSANIIQNALTPLTNLLLFEFQRGAATMSRGRLALYTAAHLTMAFLMAVLAMSFSLRVFGRLTRNYMRAGKELEKGNVAVGLLLAGVVFVVGMYIGDGVEALAKSLIPQAGYSSIQLMR